MKICFNIVTGRPINVLSFVIDNNLYLSGQFNHFIVRILKLVLLGNCLKNVIKGFFFVVNPHVLERVLLLFLFFKKSCKLFCNIVKDFVSESFITTAIIVLINNSLETVRELHTHNAVDFFYSSIA